CESLQGFGALPTSFNRSKGSATRATVSSTRVQSISQQEFSGDRGPGGPRDRTEGRARRNSGQEGWRPGGDRRKEEPFLLAWAGVRRVCYLARHKRMTGSAPDG